MHFIQNHSKAYQRAFGILVDPPYLLRLIDLRCQFKLTRSSTKDIKASPQYISRAMTTLNPTKTPKWIKMHKVTLKDLYHYITNKAIYKKKLTKYCFEIGPEIVLAINHAKANGIQIACYSGIYTKIYQIFENLH